MTRAARNATCCGHAASDHDTHGCAVNVSTHSRTYERCHGLVTAPDARQNDELREALARHLADEDAATRGALPYADTSWACVRDRWLPKADALLPVVTAWAEEQARARAAEPILCPKCKGLGVVSRPPWVPADVHTWSQPTAAPYRCDLCDGRKVVTTAALAADDRTDAR